MVVFYYDYHMERKQHGSYISAASLLLVKLVFYPQIQYGGHLCINISYRLGLPVRSQ